MKLYTATFNANFPKEVQINIPNFQDSKIGIEVYKDNEKIELTKNNVSLKYGEDVIAADGVYQGFVTIPVTTNKEDDDKDYILKVVKGGVTYAFNLKVNSNESSEIDVDKDTITPPYELPVASSEILGGVKVGDTLTIDEDGVLDANQYELPIASSTSLGGVKVGENLTIDANGTLNAQGGSYNAAIIVQPYRAQGEWYISEGQIKEQTAITSPYTDPIKNPPLYFINPNGSQTDIHTIIIVENGVEERYECESEMGMPINYSGTPLFILSYERGQLYFWGYNTAQYAWADPMPDGETLLNYSFKRTNNPPVWGTGKYVLNINGGVYEAPYIEQNDFYMSSNLIVMNVGEWITCGWVDPATENNYENMVDATKRAQEVSLMWNMDTSVRVNGTLTWQS